MCLNKANIREIVNGWRLVHIDSTAVCSRARHDRRPLGFSHRSRATPRTAVTTAS